MMLYIKTCSAVDLIIVACYSCQNV